MMPAAGDGRGDAETCHPDPPSSDRQRYLTAHHEAGHAVATLMRGRGELVSVTIDPTDDYLGRTSHRGNPWGDDALFVTFAGPWAEAYAEWPLHSLDGEDDDGRAFSDYLADAWLAAEDGDQDIYDELRGEWSKPYLDEIGTRYEGIFEHDIDHIIQFAASHGIVLPGELSDRQEHGWARQLESAWGVIQHVAKLLLAGATVTDAVVRELVDEMWARYEDGDHD